ncbi:T9SS type A sorting domain-containing protein [Candidatus Poribacteria bacterium]|nr:T9SS type A sorting domain-containing protein [Candidatus Poribacteria bacterium]
MPTIGTWGDSVADFNDDGFLDIVFNNERDDTSFDINSYIYWGSVSGFSSGNKTELPTHGARFGTTKDLGDAYTRQPEFVYISSADDTSACNSHFDTLSWDAQTPPGTYVQFQIRTAETQEALASASWYGPTGSDRYTVSGTPINSIHSGGRWVQYRVFLGTNYINTPTLDSVTITFNEDTTPPVISSVTATPNLLWPPNHQLVTVTVSVTASDDSGSPVTNQIVSVTSNEPDDGLGDGDTPNDIQNINELTVQLRAERSGKGTGRIYTITVSSTDACGNTATATVAVTVPKNQGKGAPGLVPAATALSRNYPNPFNPETWIPFALASDTDVTIKIFDVRGKLVRRLDLGSKEAGFYMEHSKAAYWDGRNDAGEQVSSGVYFYTLEADTFTATRKMVIAR